MMEPLLDVRGLKKYFPIAKGLLHRVTGQVRAVDDVSFTVNEGETLGLVGESGCGKTTIVALHPARDRSDRWPDAVSHPARQRRRSGADAARANLCRCARRSRWCFRIRSGR